MSTWFPSAFHQSAEAGGMRVFCGEPADDRPKRNANALA